MNVLEMLRFNLTLGCILCQIAGTAFGVEDYLYVHVGAPPAHEVLVVLVQPGVIGLGVEPDVVPLVVEEGAVFPDGLREAVATTLFGTAVGSLNPSCKNWDTNLVVQQNMVIQNRYGPD